MAEGLSELHFRRAAMGTLALLLVSLLPCGAAIAAPSNTHTAQSVSAIGRAVRVSLINMSGKRRQVRLKSGDLLELPVGVCVDVATQIGTTVYVVSDMDSSLDERIVVESGDERRILLVR